MRHWSNGRRAVGADISTTAFTPASTPARPSVRRLRAHGGAPCRRLLVGQSAFSASALPPRPSSAPAIILMELDAAAVAAAAAELS